MFDYIHDPIEIYRRSFETVRREANFLAVPAPLTTIAERLVHACGMPEIISNLAWGGEPARAIREALETGSPILVDSEMVGAGIMRSKLPAKTHVICTLNEYGVPLQAKKADTTRSAAAVELWLDHLDGAITVFGNAPTALFRLLELLADGSPKPAVILGFPVGFIGAAESKSALIAHAGTVPFLTLKGRLGGSAMAAAALNAVLVER